MDFDAMAERLGLTDYDVRLEAAEERIRVLGGDEDVLLRSMRQEERLATDLDEERQAL